MKNDLLKEFRRFFRCCRKGGPERQSVLELEYVMAENRILKEQLQMTGRRLNFTNRQRIELAGKAKAIGARMYDLATIVRPETLLRWHRKLVAGKFDASRTPRRRGRPLTEKEIEKLVLSMAGENPAWGYRHIRGVLKTLGHEICAVTIANILKRHGYDPNGKRKKRGISWMEFISTHLSLIWATDFFTVEVWTKAGLITYHVLFFIHLQTRRVIIPDMTPHPTGEWIADIIRGLTACAGGLNGARYCIHDRGGQYTAQFDTMLEKAGIHPIRLPPMSPNLNAYAERFVLTIKSECLNHLIPVGEASLRRAIGEFLEYYHSERPHQGIGNVVPFPDDTLAGNSGRIMLKKRLGGLLKFYYRDAA